MGRRKRPNAIVGRSGPNQQEALPLGAVGLGNSKGKIYLIALSLGTEQRGKCYHLSATNGSSSVAIGLRVLRQVQSAKPHDHVVQRKYSEDRQGPRKESGSWMVANLDRNASDQDPPPRKKSAPRRFRSRLAAIQPSMVNVQKASKSLRKVSISLGIPWSIPS
jgi:hypothetical protein